jgi:hypothetical protein
MKKKSVLNLFAGMLILFTSCSPTVSITIPASAKSGTIDIDQYKLDEAVAAKMIKSYKGRLFFLRKKSKHYDAIPGVFDAIRDHYPASGDKIEIIYARYKGAASVQFYREKINSNPQSPDAWKVNHYTTLLTVVTETRSVTDSSGMDPMTTTTTYYSYTKLCPPPLNGCN